VNFSVKGGDFIVSCAGTIGKISLLPQECKEGVINQALVRIRTDKTSVIDQFFLILFKSKFFQQQIIDSARGGAMQNMASIKEIKTIPIRLPSIEEQTEIVRRVEQLFTYADQIEQRVKDAQVRVNHLTQAILAKAFRGELTADWREQNPDLINGENSAEALLAKIKAERELHSAKKSTRQAKA
jgi:type I restriction enzyme S subunit